MVKENLAIVRKRIEEAASKAGRDPEEIKLIAVTKEAGLDQIRGAIEAGITHIGENRVKDASFKKQALDSRILTWHMVGHLQSNKVKEAVRIFSVLHSLDSVKSAYIIDTEAKKHNKVQDMLVEVNVSGEESKFGIKPDGLANFLEETRTLKNLNIMGLMTMAPLTDDPEVARPYFRKLKELAGTYNLRELSMGMTQDFEVAVEEGATMVRIGSAIFKEGVS